MSDKKHYVVVCGALALAGHNYKYGDTIELTDAQYARQFFQLRVRPALAVADTGAQDRIAELGGQVAELQAENDKYVEACKQFEQTVEGLEAQCKTLEDHANSLEAQVADLEAKLAEATKPDKTGKK